MFRSKKDVDRHVQDIFRKLKNENEKNLRCYNIAKLYYQVGDYESAKRYVSTYLEVREGAVGAHKLLGQALEALGQKEAALNQYKISLELEHRQDDLVLKVCELLADMDVSMDVNRVRYWVERADKLYPHHPTVFQLKEKMLVCERPNDNSEDLEALIASELSARPTDVHLRIKLLKHYILKQKFEEAYNHAVSVEATHSHRNSVVWYQSLSELLAKCKESKQSEWSFWVLYISVLERYATLSLREHGNEVNKTVPEATQAVFNFDQSLTEMKAKDFTNNPAFTENMLLHMWGQLHYHLACLLLRKTKREQGSWTETGRLCAPLLLTALHVSPIDVTAAWVSHLKDRLKSQARLWYREGSYRCSQAGHVLQDYGRGDAKKLMDKIDKFCTGRWREHIYDRIFVNRVHQQLLGTSYFANHSPTNPPLRLASSSELKRFDEVSEEVWPDSLHHQVWLGLRTPPHNIQYKETGPHPNQTSHVFPELQFSVYNLNQAAPDSLCRLDIDAFLNAAIFCAAAVIKEQQLGGFLNPDRLPTLPADLTGTLCTSIQENWWSAAYKMYSKQEALEGDIGDIRQQLQQGLEVVRCIGSHGLHPTLIVHLARVFHYRVKLLKEKDKEHGDIPPLEARCELYWANAVPLLERLQNNQTIRIANNKLFNYQGKEMNNAELSNALEEGRLLLAQRFLRDKQYEQAIDALQVLKCPEASFQQGQIYKTLADDIVSSMPRESLTSEMRSQHIIMLSKAKSALYLTLDRLRSPGTNPKHPLNSELCTHISDIENELRRIDPDLSRGDLSRIECDGMSDESYSSAHSGVEQPISNTALPTLSALSTSVNVHRTPQKNSHRTPKQSSTPCRPQHQDILDLSRNRTEARPSPERLDAQIRQMIHSRDSIMQTIIEQMKAILESNKAIMDKVEGLMKEMAELRKDSQRQSAQSVNVNSNLEEDLYVLGDDDYSDLNYNANQSAPTSSISGNMFTPSHRHPYSPLVYPPATAFQGYYQGGLPFPDPNAQAIAPLYPPNAYPMPVFYPNRTKMPENMIQPGLFTPRLPTQIPDLMPATNQPLQMPLQKVEVPKSETVIKDSPVNKVLPVNVVITTSDTLPTTAPIVQPTLSVTIPAHYRLGGTSTTATTEQPNVPHSYQISMPSDATIPTTVHLPSLATTLTTTPAHITMPETAKMNSTNICSIGSPNTSSEICETEHDPIPDFVPVIPLPAEIKVTTGEEDEVTLYRARAKLFRFVDKEWKERGVGKVKLLKNAEGKVRLLMRRDQVLKICANHLLTPDMELSAMPHTDKAWMWVAHDFADETVQLEKLCIRFKTADEARRFKEEFDKAKANLPPSPEKGSKHAEKPSTDVASTSETISSVKEKTTTSPATIVGGFSFSSQPIIQKVSSTVSKATNKPEETPKPGPFAGFSFKKSVTTSPTSVDTTQKNTVTGISTPAPFSFGNTSSSTSSTEQEVISIVGIQEGGEKQTKNEEVLFEGKATLQYYKSDTNQWENRGFADVKILWDNISRKSGKVRLLMSEENTSKTCYNYRVLANMPFTFKNGSDTVITWSIPCEKQDGKTGKFMATFKSADQALKFHKTILNNQQKMVKDCIPDSAKKNESASQKVHTNKAQTPLSQLFKPPAGSWECEACYTRNTSDSCVACNNPRPSTTTGKPGVPTATSVSRTPAAEPKSQPQKIQTNTTQTPLSELFKPPAGSWECEACYTRNTSDSCVACNNPRPFTTTGKPGVPTATSVSQTPAVEPKSQPQKIQTNTTQTPLSELFKPPAGSWECEACYTRNTSDSCLACNNPRPSSIPGNPAVATATTVSQAPATGQKSVPFKASAESWTCKECRISNLSTFDYCVACDNPRDQSLPPKPKTSTFHIPGAATAGTPTFSFGIPQDKAKESSGEFTFRLPASNDKSSMDTIKFGIPPTTEASAKSDGSETKFVFGMPPKPSTPTNKDAPFVFGSPKKTFDFNFVAKSPTKSVGAGDNSEDEVVESDDIHFSPIIPLPDKIDVKTGEENEEVVYSHRAKLYRFDANVKEWKERGLGDIKLLRHNETGKLRLIMRRDQILKLCLNHIVLPDLEFSLKDDKTWQWNAADYSDGEIEWTLFACRFKTPGIAESFKKAIDDARNNIIQPVSVDSSTEKVEKKPASAKESPTREIEVLYEMKVAPEEEAAAKKLLLPENFYSYKQKPDCPGCRGCKEPSKPLFDDTVTEKSLDKSKSKTDNVLENKKPSTTFTFSTVFGEQPFAASKTNAATNDTKSATDTPEVNTSNTTSSIFQFHKPTADFNAFADKKASTVFSFGMPQTQQSSTDSIKKSTTTDKQSTTSLENLKICSPESTQAQISSSGAAEPVGQSIFSSATPTGTIFGGSTGITEKSFGLDTGKSIFGGSTTKPESGLIKLSTFNFGSNNAESVFSNNFASQVKTATPATTTAASVFSSFSSTPVFASDAMKTDTESIITTTAPTFTSNSTTSMFSGKPMPFSSKLPFGMSTNNVSPFGNTSQLPDSSTDTKKSETVTTKEEGPAFLPSNDITFSTLAAKAPQQAAFKVDPNFSFAGAGSTVFGVKKSASINNSAQEKRSAHKTENEDEEGDGTENDQEHDPHFEPIVPLPDKIEVRTGEEEEEKIFCERGKLYRYNNATKEWKERGVGEMKILHHLDHGSYRLLLRRDQVHKVVCNFLLTPDIEFHPLPSSDCAWLWAGMNHADENPAVEQLAVRFKSVELATRFKETIDRIQQTLRELREKGDDGDVRSGENEPEDEEDEVDEVDEEDEEYAYNSVTFEKRVTLFATADKETDWKVVAQGDLMICIDPNIFGERIMFKADGTGEILSNTEINMDTEVQMEGKNCIWTSIDYALDPPTRRSLKVTFSSVHSAQEMYSHF